METDYIKDLYSQEEILALAKKQLLLEKNDNEELEFTIKKIDKNYKSHNKKAISRAILNGGLLIMITSILLKSNSNLASIGTDDLTTLFEEMMIKFSFLPGFNEMKELIYPYTFGILVDIIEKVGILGLIISIKSIKIITSSLKDTKKSITMKNELNLLQEKLDSIQNMEVANVR